MIIYLNRNNQVIGPSNLALMQRKILQSMVKSMLFQLTHSNH